MENTMVQKALRLLAAARAEDAARGELADALEHQADVSRKVNERAEALREAEREVAAALAQVNP